MTVILLRFGDIDSGNLDLDRKAPVKQRKGRKCKHSNTEFSNKLKCKSMRGHIWAAAFDTDLVHRYPPGYVCSHARSGCCQCKNTKDLKAFLTQAHFWGICQRINNTCTLLPGHRLGFCQRWLDKSTIREQLVVNYTKSDPSGRVTKQTRREMQMERGCEIARQMGNQFTSDPANTRVSLMAGSDIFVPDVDVDLTKRVKVMTRLPPGKHFV